MNDAVASHLALLLREVYLSDDVVTCSNGDINAVCFMLTIEHLTDPTYIGLVVCIPCSSLGILPR